MIPKEDNTYQQYHRRVFAHHEAGHATIAYRLGRKFDHIEVIPSLTPWLIQFGGSMGHIDYIGLMYDETKRGIEALDEVLSKQLQAIIYTYAGPVAEARLEIDPNKASIMEYLDCIEKCLDTGKGAENSDYEEIERILQGLENIKLDHVKPENFSAFDHMYDPERIMMRAISMVEKDWDAITRLAEALIERGRLSYDEVCEIIETA